MSADHGLIAAVTEKVLARAAGTALSEYARADRVEVNILRSHRGWAFGAGILTAPKVPGSYPQGWLFVATQHSTGPAAPGDWRVVFEGEPEFPGLAGEAPMLAEEEKLTFSSHGEQGTGPAPSQAGGDFRTGMRLPYAVGQSWYYTGGPHGGNRESIDLAGGDGRVLAARAGTLYLMCSSGRGWLRVVHDRGYSTDYYHLWNNRTDSGAQVAEGAYLGDIGTDVSCGGIATGPHVHFSLRQNGSYVSIQSHNLGKWVPYNGSAEYEGHALHGSTRVNVDGSLYNYGSLGLTRGVIDTNGGGQLNRRSGPGTGYAIVGTVPDGETVSIACSASGTSHTGRFNYTTSMWNKLTDGSWVSDAFVWTGTAGPVNGWC